MLVGALAGACSSSSSHAVGRSSATSVRPQSAAASCDGVRIYMRTSAAGSEVAQVVAALRRDNAVVSYRFLDHAAAYADAKKLFHDDPDLLTDVKPSDLPEYFQLRTLSGTDRSQLAAKYAHLSGVANASAVDLCSSMTASKAQQIDRLRHQLRNSLQTVPARQPTSTVPPTTTVPATDQSTCTTGSSRVQACR
jgi:hypothetical protein